MRRRQKYTFVAMLIFAFSAVAFDPVPLADLVRESDVVVEGKLEITRENGLVVTWHPEMQEQKRTTTRYHIGRILAPKLLYKREREERNYNVACNSSSNMTSGAHGIWLLRWNSLLGRYELSQPHPHTSKDVEKA